MSTVTLFQNFNIPVESRPIEEILFDIKNGRWQQEIIKLRQMYGCGNKNEFEHLKKALPAFTPSGMFEGGRKPEFLKQYSGFIILDIDKLSPDTLSGIKEEIIKEPLTFACFISPSGTGLKIIVHVSTGTDEHKNTFIQLQFHFEKLLGIPIDKSGKDVTRLCFVSNDSDTYINLNSVIYKPQAEIRHPDINAIYEETKLFTEQKESFTEGNRNNFVFRLACNLKKNGLQLNEALQHILNDYNYNETEVTATVKSAFNNDSDKAVQPETRKRRITSNKFILAREYIKKHFDIRRNIVTQEYECREIGQNSFLSMNENHIFIEMQISGLNISLNNLVALLKSNYIPAYNPFFEYFNNLPQWDMQTDHIQQLAGFVKTKDRQRFDRHFKKWLVRVVACALYDTYFNKQAFVLVHDKQNSGKSTFCRFLCPPALSDYIAENISIDKDSRILLTRNLLINLDELSTLSKVEINSLKSLFSKDKINERLPYDRRNSIIPRRCSFIGSTNQIEFLNDETGSVRWLCFIIDEIDWSYKDKVDIDKVYAQAYYLLQHGFQLDLTPDDIRENDEYNRQFHITTSEFELIHQYLSPATRESYDTFMTATDIVIYLTGMTDNKIKLNTNNVGKALKMLTFTRDKKQPEKTYGYYVYKKSI